jgi:hypothetical protein
MATWERECAVCGGEIEEPLNSACYAEFGPEDVLCDDCGLWVYKIEHPIVHHESPHHEFILRCLDSKMWDWESVLKGQRCGGRESNNE